MFRVHFEQKVQPSDVASVLLNDGWHQVQPGTFLLYTISDDTGWDDDGFTFMPAYPGGAVFGSLDSIHAVRTNPATPPS